jgi:hypothetical protein
MKSEPAEKALPAVLLCAVLVAAAGAFAWLAVVLPPESLPKGLMAGPFEFAIFAYILAETDIPQKIRRSDAIRSQFSVWMMWLALLGIAPALSSGDMPLWLIAAVGAGFFGGLSIFSLIRDLRRCGQAAGTTCHDGGLT